MYEHAYAAGSSSYNYKIYGGIFGADMPLTAYFGTKASAPIIAEVTESGFRVRNSHYNLREGSDYIGYTNYSYYGYPNKQGTLYKWVAFRE